MQKELEPQLLLDGWLVLTSQPKEQPYTSAVCAQTRIKQLHAPISPPKNALMIPNVTVARQVPLCRPYRLRATVVELILVCCLIAADSWWHRDCVLALL